MDITRDNLEDFFQGLQTRFRAGVANFESLYPRYATVVPSRTSQELYRWLATQLATVREFKGERVVRNIETEGFSVVNKTWELTIGVDRDDIKDDQLGIYGPMFEDMATEVQEHKDQLIADILNDNTATGFDGKALLANDHPMGGSTIDNLDSGGSGGRWYLIDDTRAMKPTIFQLCEDVELVSLTSPDDPNVFWKKQFIHGTYARYAAAPGFWPTIYGSNQTLNASNLETAIETMRGWKARNGRPLNRGPRMLMVPTNREFDARDLLMAERDASGATNTLRGELQLMVNPYLSTT